MTIKCRAALKRLVDTCLDKALVFVTAQCAPVVDVPDVAQAKMVLLLCDKMLRDTRQEVVSAALMERIFVFSVMWGIGGALDSVSPATPHHLPPFGNYSIICEYVSCM